MTALSVGIPNKFTVKQHFAPVAKSKSASVYLNAFQFLVESASKLAIVQVWRANMQLLQPLSDETYWIKKIYIFSESSAFLFINLLASMPFHS